MLSAALRMNSRSFGFRHAMLERPAVAVGADFVITFRYPVSQLRRTLKRQGGCGYRARGAVVVQQVEQAGRPCAHPVLIVAFVGKIASRAAQGHAQFVDGIGVGIAVRGTGFSSFLNVQNHGEGDPAPARPAKFRVHFRHDTRPSCRQNCAARPPNVRDPSRH